MEKNESYLDMIKELILQVAGCFLVVTSSAAQNGIFSRANNNNVDVTHPEFMLHPSLCILRLEITFNGTTETLKKNYRLRWKDMIKNKKN